MSENSGEKTEQPTSKKRLDSKKKGQVGQSKELNKAAALIVLMVMFGMTTTKTVHSYANYFQAIIQKISGNELGLSVISSTLWEGLKDVAMILVLPILSAGCVAFLVNVIQVNGIVLAEKLFPLDLNKFNPVNNIKSILAIKNVLKFFRQLIEITIMALVAMFIIKRSLSSTLNLPYYGLMAIMWYMALLLLKVFAALLSIHLFCAIIDFIMEKISTTKQLMMTPSEIKNENKSMNGDPEIKNRRKELHKEATGEDSGESTIANSTLILANPTHIAIVLLYRPKKFKLPIVIAKADGSKAQNIFIMAKRNDIPIIRDKWLARQLFTLANIGKYVPSSLLAAVADLISNNMHLLPSTAQELADLAQPKANIADAKLSNLRV